MNQDHLNQNARIPTAQLEAATKFGQMVACGLFTVPDAVALLIPACKGYEGSMSGLQARLTWHIQSSADNWERERLTAERQARRQIAPMLDGGRPPAACVRHIAAYNDQHGGLMFVSHEIRQIVEDERRHAEARKRRAEPVDLEAEYSAQQMRKLTFRLLKGGTTVKTLLAHTRHANGTLPKPLDKERLEELIIWCAERHFEEQKNAR